MLFYRIKTRASMTPPPPRAKPLIIYPGPDRVKGYSQKYNSTPNAVILCKIGHIIVYERPRLQNKN